MSPATLPQILPQSPSPARSQMPPVRRFEVGDLWFNDRDEPLAVKLAVAVAHYRRKGRIINHIVVNPSDFAAVALEGITVEAHDSIRRFNFWLGKQAAI